MALIKVNQVSSRFQAEKLVAADVLGISLSRKPVGGDGQLDQSGLMEIAAHAKQAISLSFAEEAGFSHQEVADLIQHIRPSYYEFTPADPDKNAEHAVELEFVASLPVPKVANGFFLSRDDRSFMDHSEYFERLVSAGVAFFQFEVDSAVDEEFLIEGSILSDIKSFFSKFPCLVCDEFESLREYPSLQEKGYFLNIERRSAGGMNYDYSNRSFSLSRIVALLRG
jgi:hypothetical protein